MNIWQLLRSLESLEESMAHFYDLLHLRTVRDPPTAAFFSRMRDEELSHRDLVRYQQRVLFRSPQRGTNLPDFDEQGLEKTLRAVEGLIADSAGLTLEQALAGSLRIERDATEQHCRSVAGLVHAELGRLVSSLGGCDREHAARLEAFARAHGIALAA